MKNKDIVFAKKFQKSYRKRILGKSKLVKLVNSRLKIFELNPRDPRLKDHQLKGSLGKFRSFSITGDVRIVYKEEEDAIVLFDIGTHAQVYDI